MRELYDELRGRLKSDPTWIKYARELVRGYQGRKTVSQLPYMDLTVGQSATEDTFSSDIETWVATFTLHTSSFEPDDADRALDATMHLLDHYEGYALPTFNVIRMHRISKTEPIEVDGYWEATITYEVWLQRIVVDPVLPRSEL